AASHQLSHEAGVLFGADPVAEAIRLKALERATHRGSPGDLPRVRHRAEPERLRVDEYVRVRLRRELRLETAEADADDAAVAVARGPLDGLSRLLEREAARDVGRKTDLDAVQLPRFLRAVANALEHVLPRATVPHALGRAEDP